LFVILNLYVPVLASEIEFGVIENSFSASVTVCDEAPAAGADAVVVVVCAALEPDPPPPQAASRRAGGRSRRSSLIICVTSRFLLRIVSYGPSCGPVAQLVRAADS
jgi:hypothetical protein